MATNDSPENFWGLYDPVDPGFLTPKVQDAPRLTQKQLAAAAEMQMQNAANEFALSFVDDRLLNLSLPGQKEERGKILSNWDLYLKNNNIPPDSPMAIRYGDALKTTINGVVAQTQKRYDESSSLKGFGAAVVKGMAQVAGAQDHLNTVVAGSHYAGSRSALRDAEAQLKLWEDDTSLTPEHRARGLASAKELVARLRLEEQQANRELAERMQTSAELGDTQRIMAQEAEQMAYHLEDQRKRIAELQERGASSPAIDAFLEAGIGRKLNIASTFTAEQAANVALATAVTGMAGVAGGPQGATAGAIASAAYLSAGPGASDVVDDINGMTPEQLAQLPGYNDLIEAGKTPAEAKAALSATAIVQGAATNAGVSMALAPFGAVLQLAKGAPLLKPIVDRVLGRTAAAGASTFARQAVTRVGSAAVTTAAEGFEEGLQRGASNLAIQNYNPNHDLMAGVADEAFMGALAGAAPGTAGAARGVAADGARNIVGSTVQNQLNNLRNKITGGATNANLTTAGGATPSGTASVSNVATTTTAATSGLTGEAAGYADLTAIITALGGADIDPQTMAAIATVTNDNSLDPTIVEALMRRYQQQFNQNSTSNYSQMYQEAMAEAAANPTVDPAATASGALTQEQVDQRLAQYDVVETGALERKTNRDIVKDLRASGLVDGMSQSEVFELVRVLKKENNIPGKNSTGFDTWAEITQGVRDGRIRPVDATGAGGVDPNSPNVDSTVGADPGAGGSTATAGDSATVAGDSTAVDGGGTGGTAQQDATTATPNEAYDAGNGNATGGVTVDGSNNRQLPTGSAEPSQGAGSTPSQTAQRTDSGGSVAGTEQSTVGANGLTEEQTTAALETFDNARPEADTLNSISTAVAGTLAAEARGDLSPQQAEYLMDYAVSEVVRVLEANLDRSAEQMVMESISAAIPQKGAAPILTAEEDAAVTRFFRRQVGLHGGSWQSVYDAATTRFHDGKFTRDQYTKALLTLQQEQRTHQRYSTYRAAVTNPALGLEAIRQTLIREAFQNNIDMSGVEMADMIMRTNPDAVSSVALEMRDDLIGNGVYDPATRTVSLLRNSENPNPLSAAHEILHHMERVMPAHIRSQVIRDYSAAVADIQTKGTPAERQIVGFMVAGAAEVDLDAQNTWFTRAQNTAIRYGLDFGKYYQYASPSEFFAENISRLLYSQFGRIKQRRYKRAAEWAVDLASAVPEAQPSIVQALGVLLEGGLDSSRIYNTLIGSEEGVAAMEQALARAPPMPRSPVSTSGGAPLNGMAGLTRSVNDLYNTIAGVTVTPSGYNVDTLVTYLDGVLPTLVGTQAQDAGMLRAALMSGDYTRADNIITVLQSQKDGSFALTKPASGTGVGVDTIVSRFQRGFNEAYQNGLMDSWNRLSNSMPVTSYETLNYIQRPFSQVLVDGVAAVQREQAGVAPADPWYETLPHAHKVLMTRLSNESGTTITLTTNDIVAHENVTSAAVATESLDENSGRPMTVDAVQAWVKDGNLAAGKVYTIIDKATGVGYIYNPKHEFLYTVDTALATRYGDGTAYNPNSGAYSVVSLTTDGATTGAAGVYSGTLNNAQTFIVDNQQSMVQQVQAEYEADMQANVLPGSTMPEAVKDTDGAPFASSTQTKAETQFDSEVVVEMSQDPMFSDLDMAQPGNDWADAVSISSEEALAMLMDAANADERVPDIIDMGLELPASAINGSEMTQAPQEAPAQPTDEERQAMSQAIVEAANITVAQGTPPQAGAAVAPTVTTPIPANALDEFLQGVLTQQLARNAATEAAQKKQADFFSPTQTQKGGDVTGLRAWAAKLRSAMVDARTPLLTWIMKWDAVTNGEFDDHSLWKSMVLSGTYTQAIAEQLTKDAIIPFEQHVQAVANRLGKTAANAGGDLATYATLMHIVTEGSPAFRRRLVERIQELQADPALSTELQEAQVALQKYDAYQADPNAEQVPVAGGRRDMDAINDLAYLENDLGYTQQDLQEAQRLLVEAGNTITNARLEAGTLTPDEVAQWEAFQNYVPLLVEQQKGSTLLDDPSTIYNPARDHERVGSMAPSMNAYEAIIGYVNRASAEIGGNMFRQELNNMYIKMRKTPEAGLRRMTVSEIAALPFEERQRVEALGGWTMRLPVPDGQGGVIQMTHRLFFEDEAIAKAFKASTEGIFLKALANVTSFYGQLMTRYRPGFAMINAMRDIIERGLHTVARDFRDANGDRVSGLDVSRRVMMHSMNPKLLGNLANIILRNTDVDSYYGRIYQEFKASGADFSFNKYQGKSTEVAASRLQDMNGVKLGKAKAMSVLNRYNEVFNVLPAVASYAAMRDSGMTTGDAAFWTLDMMNLTAKGEANAYGSAWMPFFRPIMQSSANMMRTLGLHMGVKNNPRAAMRGWAAIAGATMFFTGMVSLLRGGAGDDDNGRNRMDLLSLDSMATFMPLFNEDGSLFKMPVGFGISQVSWVAANAFDRMGRGILDPGDAAKAIMQTFFKNAAPDTYPMYSAAKEPWKWFAQTFSPTIFRPVADVAVNIDTFGRPISYGTRAAGVSKASSGRHRTADVWHTAAQDVKDMFGIDMYPEQIRAFSNGVLAGNLQAIMGWLEQDSQYKKAGNLSTRDEAGVWGNLFGVSSFYRAAQNTTTQVYYDRKNQLEEQLLDKDIKLTDADNVGNAAKADAFALRQMQQGGMSSEEIREYMAIRAAEKQVKKLDKAFRDDINSMRSKNATMESNGIKYQRWQEQRDRIHRNAIRYFGN